ncbi:hypothetical protein POTOM_005083 [Populus tomentosa]|uniref:Uncharacterized protein n=1 Tax=Populus tomentosa TaxID=118781 RepID=A0A8X8ARJ9_POPTO|nr:hypothetical protein POTOM_005083 [Populus tomentosa]
MAIFSPQSAYPKPLPFPTQNPSPLPFSIHSLRLSLPPSPPCTSPTTRLRRCHAALPPLPPPQSDPPPGKDPQVKLLVVVLVLTLVKNIDASFVIDGEVVALLYYWWRGAHSNFSKLKRYDVCLCNGIGSRPKNITISLSGSEGVMDLPSRVVMISASNTLSVRARLILLNILDIENLLVIAISLDCLATLSQLQDRVQIFLAVLFWMSLFFWASIWDGKNNGRGRLNKGSRFKR